MIQKNNDLNGIILIDKPSGWGSTDVVRKIKSITKCKVGHLGTLDPLATGVLPIAIGKATKLFDIFLTKNKGYEVEFEIGNLTDTLDTTGAIIDSKANLPTKDELIIAISAMLGPQLQMPPDYSAKKINGVPAYKLARQKKTIELKCSNIIIYKFELIEFIDNKITAYIECSAGTYIRAIGRDLAAKLNIYVSMSALRRTIAGPFKIENCVKIKNLTINDVNNHLISIEQAMPDINVLNVNDIEYFKLKNGQIIDVDMTDASLKVKHNDILLGIAEIKNKKMKIKTYLLS